MNVAKGLAGNNVIANAALDHAGKLAQSALGKYLPGATLLWQSLGSYFCVNNSYVKSKLQVLFLPFRHRVWKREPAQVQQGGGAQQQQQGGAGGGAAAGGYAPPVRDVNAPDLYIPLMAVMTYMLLVGLLKGSSKVTDFSPESLVDALTAATLTTAVEIVAIKVALGVLAAGLSVRPLKYLDLLAYSAYKYAHLCVNLAGWFCFGNAVYYALLAYTGACMFYFFLSVLKTVVPDAQAGMGAFGGPSAMRGGGGASTRRTYLLFGIALLQPAAMWWLGHVRVN